MKGERVIIKLNICKARVMRDFKNVDSKGVGNSKEYGFVSYTNHEDALQALRNINNNPDIFNPNRVCVFLNTYFLLHTLNSKTFFLYSDL